MTREDLILSLVQLIEPKEEKDALIKAAAIYLMEPAEKDNTPKPAGEKRPDADQDEPKPKKKGRTPFDRGKMNALLKAGWSVPKIADEMGVSVQTIKKYMKEEGYR